MKSNPIAAAILSFLPAVACDGPVRSGGEVDPVRTCGAADQPMPVGFRIDLPEGVVEPVPSNNLSVTYDARGTLLEAMGIDEMCVTPCPVTSFGFQERCPILPQGQRVDCPGATVPALRFVVQENPGRRWTVTVSPQGVADQWVSAARQALGKTVDLHVRYRTVFQNSLALGDLPAEALLHALEARGVFASAGSACASRTAGPSHVLRAIGVGERTAVLRFSLSRDTTTADIDAAVVALQAAVAEVAPTAARRR